MNTPRMEHQVMKQLADKFNIPANEKQPYNIEVIWMSPSPNRAERRLRYRDRVGYTRPHPILKKVRAVSKRTKNKSSLGNKFIEIVRNWNLGRRFGL